MTAVLEGAEWSAARPSRTLPPGKTRYPFYRRLGGIQGWYGRAENLVPTGIRSRTVQHVVSRYTDWATEHTYGGVELLTAGTGRCEWSTAIPDRFTRGGKAILGWPRSLICCWASDIQSHCLHCHMELHDRTQSSTYVRNSFSLPVTLQKNWIVLAWRKIIFNADRLFVSR